MATSYFNGITVQWLISHKRCQAKCLKGNSSYLFEKRGGEMEDVIFC